MGYLEVWIYVLHFFGPFLPFGGYFAVQVDVLVLEPVCGSARG